MLWKRSAVVCALDTIGAAIAPAATVLVAAVFRKRRRGAGEGLLIGESPVGRYDNVDCSRVTLYRAVDADPP